MSHVESLQTSSLYIHPLSSSSSRQAVAVFTQLLSSCAGPNGKNHIVRNACGGHLTITSSCSRLLSSISFSRSELKLLVSAINGHLQQHADCGLLMAHVCLQLTNSALDMNIPHSIASSAFLSFVSIIINYIKSDSCDIRTRADFTDVKPLLSYTRSILTSKALLNIQPQELHSFSLTILNSFVNAIPAKASQRYSSGVFVIGQDKNPVKSSKSVNGILLEFPELSLHKNPDELNNRIKFKQCTGEENGTFLKVALVTCSMSGDIEDIVNATIEGTLQQFDDLEECVFQQLISFCESLERLNVAIVLCQKVIHPRLKILLKSKGMIFMDRLGSQPVPYIRDLTGCVPVTSVMQSMEGLTQCIGKLTSVCPLTENKKGYICLKRDHANVVTLVVCAEFEERLSELKLCVSTCLRGLESLAKEPWLLMGGGCWQMHCSHVLQQKVLSTLPQLCEKLSCSEFTVKGLLTVFRSCLHKWCLGLKHNLDHLSFDPMSFHCWRVSKNLPLSEFDADENMRKCSCGFKVMPLEHLEDFDIVLTQGNIDYHSNKTRDDSVPPSAKEVDVCDNMILDSLTACVDALHKGVLTAGLLLSVGQLICDKN